MAEACSSKKYGPSSALNLLCLRDDRLCTRPIWPPSAQGLCYKHASTAALANLEQGGGDKTKPGSGKFDQQADSLSSSLRADRRKSRRQRWRDTAETLLEGVTHYRRFLFPRSTVPRREPPANQQRQLSEYEESSDDDVDVDCQKKVLDFSVLPAERDVELDSSNDPLRRAGVLTNAEALSLCRDKSVRLFHLYNEYNALLNFKQANLDAQLRRAIVADKHKFGVAGSYRESVALRKFKYLKRYCDGREKRVPSPSHLAVVKNEALRQWRGLQKEEGNMKKCSKDECPSDSVPLADYCQAHIMEDERQLLFVTCKEEDCHDVFAAVFGSCSSGVRCEFHRYLVEEERSSPAPQQEEPNKAETEEDLKAVDATTTDVEVKATDEEVKPTDEEELKDEAIDVVH